MHPKGLNKRSMADAMRGTAKNHSTRTKVPLGSRLHISAQSETSRGISAVEQIGPDEGVDIPIEHPLHVAPFHFCAVILNKLVGLHDLGANLAAKADLGLRGIQLPHRRPTLLNFLLIEL